MKFDQTVPAKKEMMKILIVDDSILIRRSLVKLIDQTGSDIEIAEAVNVPEGIRLLKEFKPDVIIVDIRMPGGSGFDVMKAAKQLKDPPSIIVLSKYSTDAFRQEAKSCGADHFIDKSSEFKKIVEIIELQKNN